ncbi:MAG: hypothetical protein AB7G23_02580 [Vicinamibacterales bacterium]
MYGVLAILPGRVPEPLLDLARTFSPRIEAWGAGEVALDLRGLTRLFGTTGALGEALHEEASRRRLPVRIALAGSWTTARLLVRAATGTPDSRHPHGEGRARVAEPGEEAGVLAPLPVGLLQAVDEDGPPAEQRAPAMRPTTAALSKKTVPGNTAAGLTVSASTMSAGTVSAGTVSASTVSAGTVSAGRTPMLVTLHRWGIRTLGELAALPADAVAARLGPRGLRWHRLARGTDPRPLRPLPPEERFEQACDLEWPIEGREPLAFVLARLLEPLSAQLERRDRGVAVLRLRLHLITREVHERALQLPTPLRDPVALRTLALLDLESHPPDAAIDRVVVSVDPTPGRIIQYSLLTRPLPSPERLSTLLARLQALVGEDRCGSPLPVDSWAPGACAMTPFAPVDRPSTPLSTTPLSTTLLSTAPLSTAPLSTAPLSTPSALAPALRRFRRPVPVRVRVVDGQPVHVLTDRPGLRGGRVRVCGGPYRSSGHWWMTEDAWDRDEWDMTLEDGVTYRLARDQATGAWSFDGLFD